MRAIHCPAAHACMCERVVRESHPHQHWWLARQHAAEPGAGLGRSMDMPLDDDAVGPDDEQPP